MSKKTFNELSNQTIRGAALLQLAQNSAGSDDLGSIVYGGAAAFTAGIGNAVTAKTGMTAGTAATAGTVLTLSGVTGWVAPGDVVSDGTNTATILSLGTSTGGNGTVNLVARPAPSASAWDAGSIAVTSTSNVLDVTAVTAADALLTGSLAFAAQGSWTAANITSQISGTPGGIGQYAFSGPGQSVASSTLDVKSDTMHVTATSAGVIGGGNAITAPGGAVGLTIAAQVLPLIGGETLGGVGRYTLTGAIAYVATVNTFTTGASTAAVDGDYIEIFHGSWTGRAYYESNTDVSTLVGRKYVTKFMTSGAGLTLADSSLNNTNTGVIKNVGVTAHGRVVGEVFAVGTEFFLVVNVPDVNHVDVLRGYGGSTVATHASTTALLTAASLTNVNLGYDIIVPVTSIATIATFAPQVVAAMNALDGFNPKWNGSASPANGIQQTIGSKKTGLIWEYDSTYDDRFLFYRPSVTGATGPSTPTQSSSTTVTIGGSIANGAITGQLNGGVQVGEVARSAVLRVVTAAEAALAGSGGAFGRMDFAFPYPVKGYQVLSFTTATGAATADAASWVVTFSTDFKRMTVAGVSGHALATTITAGVDVYF